VFYGPESRRLMWITIILYSKNLGKMYGRRNMCVGDRRHSWITAGVEPNAHQFLCHDSFNG
jgi:hypothetical protein